MLADKSHVDCDPEQAGIILDLLAKELEHAAAKNPKAVAGLRRDAGQFLRCITPWLEREAQDLVTPVRTLAVTTAPPVLARRLRSLAEQLLELSDRLAGGHHGDNGQ